MPRPRPTGDFLVKSPWVPGVSSSKLKEEARAWAKMQGAWAHTNLFRHGLKKYGEECFEAFRFVMIDLGLESP